VVSPTGFVLGENHDTHELDPQLVFSAPADGTYIVRLFAFPSEPNSTIRFAGGEDYVYRLTVTTGGFVDHPYPLAVPRSRPGQVELVGWNISEVVKRLAVRPVAGAEMALLWDPRLANTAEVRVEPHQTLIEQEPNDRDHAQPLPFPATISGQIEPPGDVDVYRFRAKKGEKRLFQVEAERLGSPLDPMLRLLDASGKITTEVTSPRKSRDVELSFTAPADGDYRLEVSDLYGDGGSRYVYRLRAVAPEPDYALTVAADRFVMAPGKPLELPVKIERRYDFDHPVELAAEGLPEGVTATVTKIRADESSAKLRLTATKGPLSAPFRVVGKAGPGRLQRTAQFAFAKTNATTAHLWLTVLKPGAKEEKPAKPKK
jgi:hypothetical protein